MEALGFGLVVTLIGMAVTFVGLVILILLINGLVRATTRKKKPEAQTGMPGTAAADIAGPSPAADSVKAEDIDAEAVSGAPDASVVAAITAALAVVMRSGSGFTVRRIRRV